MVVITLSDIVGLGVLAVVIAGVLLFGIFHLVLSAYDKVCDWIKSWRKK